MQVRRFEPSQEGGPRPVHGHLVEPAGGVLGRDQDDVRSVRLLQPFGQGLGHDGRGEVLIFQIEAASGGCDRRQGRRLALPALLMGLPGRLGPRDSLPQGDPAVPP